MVQAVAVMTTQKRKELTYVPRLENPGSSGRRHTCSRLADPSQGKMAQYFSRFLENFTLFSKALRWVHSRQEIAVMAFDCRLTHASARSGFFWL